MSEVEKDWKSFNFPTLLRQECWESIPKRKSIELFLLGAFLTVFTVIVVHLWVNGLRYEYWFYFLILIVLGIVLTGYWMDKVHSPNWEYYLLEIIKEMNVVDTFKLSDYINDGQPFLGANLGNSEKFLKIAERFIKNETVDIVIRGEIIYMKGFEPPPEEKEETDSEKAES